MDEITCSPQEVNIVEHGDLTLRVFEYRDGQKPLELHSGQVVCVTKFSVKRAIILDHSNPISVFVRQASRASASPTVD